jgi:hypothetical protein
MARQQENVVVAVAQWWELDARDGESMKEVVSKTSGRDGFVEIAACGGEHAHVDLDRLRTADAA